MGLEAAIRAALSVGAQEDLTCGVVSGLTTLVAQFAGITSLVGIQNLTGLTNLHLDSNSISDISLCWTTQGSERATVTQVSTFNPLGAPLD